MSANDPQLQTLIGINQQLQRSEEFTRKLGSLNERLGISLVSILRSTQKYSTAIEDIVELEAKGSSSIKDQIKLKDKLKDLQSKINVLASKQEVYSKSLTKLQADQLKDLKDKIKLSGNISKQQEGLLKILDSQNIKGQQRTQLEQFLEGKTARRAKVEEEIQNIVKNNAEVLQPFLIERQKESLQLAKKELESTLVRVGKLKNIIELTKEYFKENFTGAKGLAVAIAAVAAAGFTLEKGFEIVKNIFFATDSAATNIAKSSGVSAEFSREIIKSYRTIQDGSEAVLNNLNSSLATNKSLLEAQQELQASVEASALYTKSSVESQVYLTKQLGLSAEEAVKLNSLSLLTGQTTEETTAEVYKQTALANDQNKIRLRGTTILKEVAKIEGVLAVNYGNNVSRIAAAVAQTKALGTNLQSAATASRSLLDFESSIENELEAELLTGRKFNLEKARSLALDGDSAGAVKEMLKNIGSLNDFQKQNVLAKEAEAKAVGMTVDELSNSLRQQELLRNLSKEDLQAKDEILAKISDSTEADRYRAQINSATNAEQLRAAEQSITKQEKFNAAIDKLKDKIAEIGEGPLIILLNDFEKAIEFADKYSVILKGVAVLMTAIAVATTVASFGANIGLAAGAIATSAGIGAVLGGGAAGTLLALNDGVVDPSGGIVLQTPKGQIKTNKDDYIVATTNPGALLGGSSSNRTDQILSAILTAVSKPSGVYIDSYRAGTALGMSNSAFA